jgi:archaeosine-15-forming tRNA-guanine transglycosylase
LLRRIGVVVVVVVVMEYSLGENAHKKLFSHKKKIHLSTTTRVRSQLAYP